MNKAEKTHTCICGSQKNYAKCCGRFLTGKAFAKTPEQLMRSRYSAYALGGMGEYLLKTWLPATAQGLTALSLSESNMEWVGLEVLNKSQKGHDGEVEFNAFFRREKGSELEKMHEKSVFKRIDGQWFYVGGEVDS